VRGVSSSVRKLSAVAGQSVARSFLGESERVPKGEKRTRLEVRSAWRTTDGEGTGDEEGDIGQHLQ